jgi:hypothetical protein
MGFIPFNPSYGLNRVKFRYLGRVDDDIERGLRVAKRAATKSDAWQRSNLGATATELKEREASQWTQQGFLEATTSPQGPDGAESAGKGDEANSEKT